MKAKLLNSRKVFIAVAVLCLMIGVFFALSLKTDAADIEGKKFTAAELYEMHGNLKPDGPITFEAELYIPDAYKKADRAGAIISNYNNPDAYAFEIRAGKVFVFIDCGTCYLTIDYDITQHMGTDADPKFAKIAVTVDTATGVATLFVNGKNTGATITYSKAATDMYNTTHTLVIGGDRRDGNGSYFKGVLKNLAMYKGIRTEAQIAADHTAAFYDTADTNLLYAYDLTNVKDGIFVDQSLNKNHASNKYWRPTEGTTFTQTTNIPYVTKDYTEAPFTYEAVVYAPPGVTDTGTIIANYPNAGGDSFSFQVRGNGRPGIYIWDEGAAKVNYQFNYDIRRGTFVHLAITHETVGSDTVFKCYVDGELVDSYTVANYVFTLDPTAYAKTRKVSIGQCGRPNLYWKGSIKNIAVHNRALSADEIKSSYTNGVDVADDGVIAYYDLTATKDGFIEDKSGNGYHANYSEWKPTEGRTFTETEEPVYLTKDLDVAPYTYEALIYAPMNVDRPGVIIGNYPNSNGDSFQFEIKSGGKPGIYIYENGENKINYAFNYDVRRNAFVHVAITHESVGNDTVFKCYVDGKLVDTYTKSGYVFTMDMQKMKLTGPVSLGACVRTSLYWHGNMKNVALHNRALSADEIMASYKNGVEANKDSLIAYYNTTGDQATADVVIDQSGNGYDMAHLFYEKDFTTEDYDYSFAVVGDTQFMVYQDAVNGTNYTEYIYNWIADNYNAKKMKYVFGLGDIIDNGKLSDGTGSASVEWAYAKNLIVSKLGANNIPYSVIGGNHDFMRPWDTGFNANFKDETSLIKNITGYYQGNDVYNYYMNFEVDGTPYMLLALEYGANDDVLAWANDVVAQNNHRRVIVTTHGYMYADGTTIDGGDYAAPKPTGTANEHYLKYNNGDEIWDEFVRKHANIALVLSGHIDYNNIVMREDIGDHGNTVHQFLIDPQKMDRAYGFKTGMVAMLYFRNGGKDVSVEYVSTYRTANNEGKEILFNRANQFDFTIKEAPAEESKGEINVWLIGGQSNAVGYAEGLTSAQMADSRYTNGFNNILYYGYGEKWQSSFAPVKLGFGNNTNTAGAELGIAAALGNTGEMNAIIKYAQGATALYPVTDSWAATNFGTWTSPSYISDKGISTDGNKTGDLYVNFINTVESAVAELRRMGYTPVIKGMWWMQGEEETYNGGADVYAELLDYLASDVRDDLASVIGSDMSKMPFVIGQIYTEKRADLEEGINKVQQQQSAYVESDPYASLVSPKGCSEYDTQDQWHFNAATQSYLGRRFVEKANVINGEYIVEIAGANVTANGGGLYKKGENVNITFDIPNEYELNTLNMKVGSGDAISILESLENMSYSFVCEDNTTFTAIAKNAYDVETDYGFIPKDESSADEYPVVLFTKAKDYIGAYQNVTDAANKAMQNPSGDYVILLRNNVSQTNGAFISNLKGSITLDLGGFTITKASSPYILEGYYSGGAFDGGKLTVKNGTMVNKEWSAFFCYNYGGGLNGDVYFDFEFENVRFVSEKANNVIIETWEDGVGATSNTITANMVFNDCIFDYTGSHASEIMFNLQNRSGLGAVFHVTVNGGQIISDRTVGMAEFATKDNADTIKFGKGLDGYIKCILANGVEITNQQFDSVSGSKLSYSEGVASGTDVVYTLGEDVVTDYGTIPYKYTDCNVYPFVVFLNGKLVLATPYFGRDNATSALSNAKVNGSVILMRRDFTYKEGQYNNLSQTYSITFDLGGHTFTSTDRVVFSAQKKTANNTALNIKNGSFVLGSHPFMKFSSWDPSTGGWAAYPGGNGFDFVFDNVDIVLTEGATTASVLTTNAFKEADPDQFCNIKFNNCSFNLEGSSNENVLLFDFSHALCKAVAEINGGEILTKGITFANLEGGNSDSAIIFGKASGKYTTLSIPEGTAFAEINKTVATKEGIDCVFVKLFEENGYVNYSLYPKVMLGYKIKSSVSLYSNLIYNIYVPINDYLSSISVNGENITLDERMITEIGDGKYYRIPVSLAVADSLDDIALSVALISGDSTVNAKWTLNVAKYANAVLSGNESDEEKSLVRDMLSYARAAYVYFNITGRVSDEELLRAKALVDELIGADYDANNAPEMKEEAVNTVGGELSSASVDLGEKISLVFVVGSGYNPEDFEFTMGGAKLEKTVVGNKVYLTTYGYAIRNTVEYTVSGTDISGSFNLMCYYENASTTVQVLLARLIKYSESAEVYKNFVVGKEM